MFVVVCAVVCLAAADAARGIDEVYVPLDEAAILDDAFVEDGALVQEDSLMQGNALSEDDGFLEDGAYPEERADTLFFEAGGLEAGLRELSVFVQEPVDSGPGAERLPGARAARAQSRTWWRGPGKAETGLGATTAAGHWRTGAAVAAGMGERPASISAQRITPRVQDAFVQHLSKTHAAVLGYYDIGFADRLTLDTTSRPKPDGIQRGAASLAMRTPKLLGGAFTWRSVGSHAGAGVSATAFAASHAAFPLVTGARLSLAYDARTAVTCMGYATYATRPPEHLEHLPAQSRSPDAARPGALVNEGPGPATLGGEALGIGATWGKGPCDVALEGALATGALAYSLRGACEPSRNWQVGTVWRDIAAGFRHPFFRSDAGRPVPDRRIAGVWTRVRRARWQAAGRVEASWRRHGFDQTTHGSIRHQVGVALAPRHVLRAQARSRHAKRRLSPWEHTASLTWVHGGRYGWGTAVASAWHHAPAARHPARVTLSGRAGWRHPAWAVGAYALTGLDAAHWRAGVAARHQIFDSASIAVRLHVGRHDPGRPLGHAGLLTAQIEF